MTPEYLEELADLADPDKLWRSNVFERFSFTDEQKRQLNTGIALRRHADHVRRLNALLGTGRSMVITPLSENSSAHTTIAVPDKHKRLLEAR